VDREVCDLLHNGASGMHLRRVKWTAFAALNVSMMGVKVNVRVGVQTLCMFIADGGRVQVVKAA